MNGKFSNIKKVLAVLVCVSMLASGFSAFAAEISPEAVIGDSPMLLDPVANQKGMNYLEIEAYVADAATGEITIIYTDEPVIATMYDKYGRLISLAYAPVFGGGVTIRMGVPDEIQTGEYKVILDLRNAEESVECTAFYVGVEDVMGLIDTINMTDAEVSEVKAKLDAHYQALSAMEYTKDENGKLLKLTGDDYAAFSEEAQTVFAELILNGVNGKFVEGKGDFTSENVEAFIKEAYLLAAYNSKSVTYEDLAEILYKFDSIIGFNAENEELYGNVEDRKTFAKVARCVDTNVTTVEEIYDAVEEAVRVQLVNETAWYSYLNLVNVVEASNEYFGVSKSQINALQNNKKLRTLFCGEFKGTYYSAEDVKDAWDVAYKAAQSEYGKSSSTGSTGGTGTTGGIATNIVSTQITDSENNKDPNVEIKDYYTDIAGGAYSWASDAILNLTKANIVSGYGDKTYKPENSVTRAEFMKMIVNVFGLADITATSAFTDVDKDAWYYIYVASAEKLGIAQGYGNGLFGVNDPVTRQDAITLVYRAATIKGLSVDKFSASASNLIDKDLIASYALEAVEKLFNTGVYLDASDPTTVNRFEPTRNATRAYLAVILNQIYNFMK